MRPVPAQRIGYAHGLLRALDEHGSLAPERLASDFPASGLFPPELGEAGAARIPQLISYGRAAGLVEESDGSYDLSELGRRYVAAGDADDVFAVTPAQADLLRAELRENHLSDSIWAGAAIGLSLWSTLGDGEWVALSDFGRAAAHVGGADWGDESTAMAQGKRLTLLLQDLELIDDRRRLTELGDQTRRELRLPMHIGLRGLADQLNPGGPEGATAAAREELAQLGLDVEPAAPADAEPPAPEPEPEPEMPTAELELTVPDAGEQAPDTPLAPPPVEPPAPPPAPTPPPASPPPVAPPPASAAPPPVAPAPPPGASGISMRPAYSLTALRPEDFARWKAEQDAAKQAKSGKGAKEKPFLDVSEVRTAAEKRGLVIDDGVYAAAIAALASGRHLVLTGGAGSGKTALALTLAETAVRRKHAAGTLFTGAGSGWGGREVFGRHAEGEFQPGVVPTAIQQNRWLVIDELDRARLDRALGRVSPLLAGQAMELPTGETLEPPAGWRVIATMGAIEHMGRASLALRRRFVFVEVPPLTRQQLDELVEEWAGGDEVAAAVGRRLIAVTDVVELGPGLFRDAIAYVRARRGLAPADETALTQEAMAGFVLPQLEGSGEELAERAIQAAGLGG